MSGHLRAAWVIARRDYVATVWSRAFLFFLLFPLLLPLVSAGLAMMSDRDGAGDAPAPAAIVRVAFDPAGFRAVADARARLARRLGDDALPAVVRGGPPGAPVLFGTLDAPHLAAADRHIDELAGEVGLIVDAARADRALGAGAPAPVRLALLPRPSPPRSPDNGRILIAHGGQYVLFFLIMLLAGMMTSNLVEEKSNKVIELLLAAVPVDAVFAGKLLAMLAVSLTGIALWGAVAGISALALLPKAALPAPAVGWPVFAGLLLLYYVMAFLLLGGLYLGIGAQAGSVREVQTMSLPLSLGQLVVLALATGAVGHPDRPLGLVADLVPWSAPYAMLARAAVDARLWPHLLGLAWQGLAVLLTIRVGAALFRANILKSAGKGVKPRRRGLRREG